LRGGLEYCRPLEEVPDETHPPLGANTVEEMSIRDAYRYEQHIR
jgi:hypothetical protein